MKLRDYAIIALLICCLGALRSVSHHSLTGLYLDDHPQYLRKDATRPLQDDWDAGDYTITALAVDVNDVTTVGIDANSITLSEQLTSTAATGTAPFVISSTTANANLNADLWDGYQFADYLDQAVKEASDVTFGSLTITGLDTTGVLYNTSGALATEPVFNYDAGNNLLSINTLKLYGDLPAYATSDNTLAIGTENANGLVYIISDQDFRAGSSNTLYVDQSENKVGIGKNNPSVELDVTGSITSSATITGEQITSTDDITMQGHLLTLGDNSNNDVSVYFDGDTNDGTLTWMEDENYFLIGNDFVLSQPVYDDVRVTAAGFDRAGVADPALASYTPTGSSIATYLYEWQVNDIAYFQVQLPHRYQQGQDISVHVHWTPGLRGNEESGATVGWKVDYTWANINGAFGAIATADLSDACDGTDDKHQMTPTGTITGTSKTISSMLICNIKRTDTGTDDTWAGTLSGQLPLLLEVDFHFPIDSMGSRDWGTK